MTWDVKVDPNNANRVYATSEYDGLIDSQAGIEISNDGGSDLGQSPDGPARTQSYPDRSSTTRRKGWLIKATPAAGRNSRPSGSGSRPDAPNNVVIGTNSGVAISHDSGATWQFVNPNPGNPARGRVGRRLRQAGRRVSQGIIYIYGDYGYQYSIDGGTTWSNPSLP